VIAGFSGSLLSGDALEHVVPDALEGLLDEKGRAGAQHRLRVWHTALRHQLGPATAARTLLDRLAVPLFGELEYRVLPDGTSDRRQVLRAHLQTRGGQPAATLLVTGWGDDLASAWRDAVRHGIGQGLRWTFCLSGPSLRLVDSLRTYSRQFVEFDLEATIDNERSFALFWGLLRASAMAPPGPGASPLLERAIAISEDHRTAVRASLQRGVDEALAHLVAAFSRAAARRLRRGPATSFDEALVVIYRVLFLLFAEARGLVPQWHPLYRDGYTIEALRRPIEMLPKPRGLWETIQSIARLAHRGCRIGALQVTPFNGRLFSPAESPLADSVPLDDGAVRQAMLALTTRPARGGRQRISYGDLGVEQLGGVYERVLDLEPASLGGQFVRSERRRATGSFYTPRALTEFLVRRTLAPLVHEASPETILSLRVLDPAMGSGAFLVAACRYLAAAYELSVVRAGAASPDDIGERERADFRRTIAQRCLYGVDNNPMAVQLGRLSLWLATLAADRPLTFLDHRLRVGNSLVGASPADLARQPPGVRWHARAAALPLFDDPARDHDVIDAIAIRDAIAVEPGETLAQVRSKEQALAQLMSARTSLSRWKAACDLWCAMWYQPRAPTRKLGDGGARGRPPFGPLLDALLDRGGLPDHVAAPFLEEARETASRERFFHWVFEFPEIFHATTGEERCALGFDAIVGNPPWEVLRGDRGDAANRASARTAASLLTGFARGSGIYAWQGHGHANLYQLFLERMISLLRDGGRLGVVAPSGLLTDHGAAPLRRRLFERTGVDTLISLDNRDGVFPIHRGLKFLIVSATRGGGTTALPCRFGLRRPDELDRLAELGVDGEAVIVTRSLLQRMTGSELAVPDVRCRLDVEILAHIASAVPALGDPGGWSVRFGRELNATDDRKHFQREGTGLPIVEGKQISPFQVDIRASRHRVAARIAGRLVNPERTFQRTRLAYRDVASATNRLTLIAALVPAGVLTTHTLFCLKDPLTLDCQRYLCGMFNSFVANYLVRLRVSTHVTATIIDRLPIPRPARHATGFLELVKLSTALAERPSNRRAYAQLQAWAAREYGLDRLQFRHVLDTFPLVPHDDRDAALAAFCDIVT
jgi:hypothetical protein